MRDGHYRRDPRRKRFFVAAAAFAALIGVQPLTAQTPDPAAKPNIVVLLVDDAALMDIGAYGGEARTPNIDSLAARGAMFTQYRTSPLCSPSRAMLLTGVDNHRTGVATIAEVLPPEHRGRPGYALHFQPGVETLASRLRAAGYRTSMAGKWHLGDDAENLPSAHGFDRSFALEASGADNWDHKSYMPYYATAPWYEDGKPARYPANTYSSEFLINRIIAYIDADAQSERPFFAYVAFLAVHIPVQAPRTFTQHYETTYAAGWDALRDARWQKAQTLGLVPQGAALAPMPAKFRRWSTLSPEDQRLHTRSMAVYAGMLEAMDFQVGRLVDHLRKTGALDTTIFVFTSDNGPEPSDPISQTGFTTWMRANGYSHDIADLGERGSLNFIGPEWASAVASPSRLFKFYASEGGIRVPLIMAGPGITAMRTNADVFVTDVTPTLLDLVGAPAAQAGTVSIDGKSLAPLLQGKAASVRGPAESWGLEVSGNSALFLGDFKLVRNTPPFGDNIWRLYNIRTDPGEPRDLTDDLPAESARLKQAYEAYVQRNGVLEMPRGYDVQAQVGINAFLQQMKRDGWVVAIIAALSVWAGIVGVRALRRRAKIRT